MDETLNKQSTVTSTSGTGNFLSSLLNAASSAYQANRNERAAEHTAKAGQPTTANPSFNWTPIAIIGGGIALLLVVVMIFKK